MHVLVLKIKDLSKFCYTSPKDNRQSCTPSARDNPNYLARFLGKLQLLSKAGRSPWWYLPNRAIGYTIRDSECRCMGITVYDKTTNEAYEDFIQFEDRGETGMCTFISNQKELGTNLRSTERLWSLECSLCKILFKYRLIIPVSDEKLDAE